MDFPHVWETERMEILRSGEHIYSHKKLQIERRMGDDRQKKRKNPKKRKEKM